MTGAKNYISSNSSGFVMGVVFTAALLVTQWVWTNWRAVVITITYPEVVKELQVEKTYTVKK